AVAWIVPDLPGAVHRIGDPDLALVGRHADAVAVAFAFPRVAGKLHALDHFSRLDVADLEADQIVHVDVDQAEVVIDRKRSHHFRERHVAQHSSIDHVDDGEAGLAVFRTGHRPEYAELAIRRERQIVRDG